MMKSFNADAAADTAAAVYKLHEKCYDKMDHDYTLLVASVAVEELRKAKEVAKDLAEIARGKKISYARKYPGCKLLEWTGEEKKKKECVVM